MSEPGKSPKEELRELCMSSWLFASCISALLSSRRVDTVSAMTLEQALGRERKRWDARAQALATPKGA